jgi:hypothetical protein
MDMNRYDFDEADKITGDQNYDSGFRRFGKYQIDQPRRSPIRRRDKFPQAMGAKSKVKRNYKKVQNKIKYDWQGE